MVKILVTQNNIFGGLFHRQISSDVKNVGFAKNYFTVSITLAENTVF